MDTKRLENSPIGRLIEISGYDSRFHEDYQVMSFLPDPLGSEVSLRAATYKIIAEAASWVGRADQAVGQLPNPALFVRPAIRREAVDTSALEGTFAAFTDILEADFLDEEELTTSVSEVRNFVLAAEFALRWITEERQITLQLVESLQKILVRGTPADNAEAGHVRTTQVFIGINSRQRVGEARFVPPPPGDLLRDGVQAWLHWLGDPGDRHAICQAAMAHYQFESLHPFNDGNGRLGRLVALLQFIISGDLRSLVMNLSPWLKEHQQEYQEHLFDLSATGCFDRWIEFFSTALIAHGQEAVRRVSDLLVLRQELIDEVNRSTVRGTAARLAGDLIGYPMLTASTVKNLCGVSAQAANTAVSRLADLGILRQRTTGRYARIFICDRVVALLERPYAKEAP